MRHLLPVFLSLFLVVSAPAQPTTGMQFVSSTEWRLDPVWGLDLEYRMTYTLHNVGVAASGPLALELALTAEGTTHPFLFPRLSINSSLAAGASVSAVTEWLPAPKTLVAARYSVQLRVHDTGDTTDDIIASQTYTKPITVTIVFGTKLQFNAPGVFEWRESTLHPGSDWFDYRITVNRLANVDVKASCLMKYTVKAWKEWDNQSVPFTLATADVPGGSLYPGREVSFTTDWAASELQRGPETLYSASVEVNELCIDPGTGGYVVGMVLGEGFAEKLDLRTAQPNSDSGGGGAFDLVLALPLFLAGLFRRRGG